MTDSTNKKSPHPLPKLTDQQINRFRERVTLGEANDCWEWNSLRDPSLGYGLFRPGGRNGRQLRAHRVAFWLDTGEDPFPFFVCHKCDNPPCCNPSHLFKGDQSDNMKDCASKQRHSYGINSPSSILNNDLVVYIRRTLRSKAIGLAELSKKLNICSGTIANAAYGNTWKHIAEPVLTAGILSRGPGINVARGDRQGLRVNPERARRGESHPNSKLSESDVVIARKMRSGGASIKELCEKFGLSKSAMYNVVTMKRWKHLG